VHQKKKKEAEEEEEKFHVSWGSEAPFLGSQFDVELQSSEKGLLQTEMMSR
jgi:hypothetical protein